MPIKYNTSSKKPKRPSGVTGFITNLADDISETATGLFPGLWHIGSSVAHDAGKLVGLTGGQFRTDDIARQVKGAYTDEGTFWHELIGDGNLGGAWRAFYNNPLGPALDVASIFTGGAGVAARGAGLAAKGARAGSVSRARLAGFAGLDPTDLSPLRRTISVDGIGSMNRSVYRNPLLRARQNAFENLSAAKPDLPLIGAGRRIARNNKRVGRVQDLRQEAKVLNPARERLSKLSKQERAAVYVAAGGHNIDNLGAMWSKTLDNVKAEKLRRRDAGKVGDSIDVEAPKQIAARSATTGTDLVKYEPSVAGPRGRTLLLEDGKPRRASINEEIRYDEGSFDDVVNAVSRMSDKELSRVEYRLRKRVAEVEQIKRSGVLDNPSERFQAAVDAVRNLSADTSQRMIALNKLSADGELRRMSTEAEVMRAAGVIDEPYAGAVRSHTIVRPDKLDTGHNRAVQFSKPGELDLFKRNTGYSFLYALDETSPEMYLHASRQVFQYQQRVRRFTQMVSDSVWMRPDDVAALEKQGWKAIEAGSKARKDIDLMYATLVDAEDVFDAVPGFDAMLKAMEQHLVRPDGSTDMVPMIPKYAYDELVGEFNQAHRFIRKWIDKPTRIWRALTLNLRPAWIVNNFVGQMLLLATAYGVRGLKEYVLQAPILRRGKNYDAFSDLAPELSDFGWAHESNLAVRDLQGNKVTRGMRRLSDFMGDLNQRLTDDHTRRAAFNAEMRPHIKRYRKANPEASYEDAAKALWNDADFADEITRRVLDNMIDFTDLSNFERSVIKRAIPFYSWLRGMTKRTGQLALDEPWKLAAGAQVGQVGIERNRELYGSALPPFLMGVIGDGGNRTFLTQGMNPFQTPADVANMALGAFIPGRSTGTQNPLTTLGPVIKVPLEAAANQDFFYGRPISDPRYGEQSSFAGRLWSQGVASFPQTRLLKEWQQQRQAENGGLEYDPLYEPSLRNALLSYLGLPIRTLDIDVARERAASDS